MYGVAGKYASALYVTAVRKNALEPVETELKQVCGAARTNPAFADFLKDPSVSKTVRVQAIEGIFRDTKFNDVTKNLLGVPIAPYLHLDHFCKMCRSSFAFFNTRKDWYSQAEFVILQA